MSPPTAQPALRWALAGVFVESHLLAYIGVLDRAQEGVSAKPVGGFGGPFHFSLPR